jgi:tellurite resistance protein
MQTAGKGVLGWIVGTVSEAFDAAKEQRIESHVARVDALFAQQRRQFDFSQAVTELGISPADRASVAERVYRRFLARGWSDSTISAREKELLGWVANALGLSPVTAADLNARAAGEVFRRILGEAIADGRVDEAEAVRLREIAEHAGESVASLMARFFQKEGDALLRSIFTQAAADGQLDREEWKQFCETASRLGIPKGQVLQAIRQPAHQLIEHALADARSDGEISDREEKMLLSLLKNIVDEDEFAAYVREQLSEAKIMQGISKGVLPSLPVPPGVALRSGEIVHWHGEAECRRTRQLANGTKTDEVAGDAIITDTRMILSAADKSAEISHRKVLAHFPFGEEIEIRTSGKGAGRYRFPQEGEMAVAIWQVAIGRANQTIVASDDSQTRRRISREIRQRVWQRYGGRCAECSADTYLEFDHIIPVAKGGGNSETNVQLLCRKCNLAKSDNI